MDSDSEDEEDTEMSVKDRLFSLVAGVLRLKMTSVEVEDCGPQSHSKCVYSMLQNPFFVYFGHSALENVCIPSLLQAH